MTLLKRNVDAIARREATLPNGVKISLPVYPAHTVAVGKKVRALREKHGLLPTPAAILAKLSAGERDAIENGAVELLDPKAALTLLDVVWRARR